MHKELTDCDPVKPYNIEDNNSNKMVWVQILLNVPMSFHSQKHYLYHDPPPPTPPPPHPPPPTPTPHPLFGMKLNLI